MLRRLLSTLSLVVLIGSSFAQTTPDVNLKPDDKPGAAGKPVKVFILMGQSNMVGMGDIKPDTSKGTQTCLTKTENKYPWLVDGDKWTERNDVYYYDARVKKGALLSPTANNGNAIGPEVGFEYVMGHVFDEPVLVLKSCIGNHSLSWDLLPPGSKEYAFEGKTSPGYKGTPDVWVEGEPKKEVNWYAGKQYDDDMANAKAVLKDLAKFYPGYNDRGYEIPGFVY